MPVVHKNRNKIVKALQKNFIEVRPLIAGNMATKPMWVKKYPKISLPNCELIEKFGFYVPNHQDLSKRDILKITDIINKYS
jgi:CDP-6-deoxy-D-xylo-4-hexulose-3-dehydrase